ncbi:MAG: DUF1549 domain-containing protein, partial [Limisphaerales bacterium]
MKTTIPTLLLFLLASVTGVRGQAKISEKQAEFFETRIRPALAEHCYGCHSTKAKKLKAELYLDNRDAALKGGESGVVIKPGDLAGSLLIGAVRYTEESLEMPPKAKLPEKVIADFEKWVAMGAPWPTAGDAQIAGSAGGYDFEKFRREHWSFKPVKKPGLPAVSNAPWTQQPIDYFVLAKLDEAGMNPSPKADKRTLIRRAYFDLIGLPPTPKQVREFVSGSKSWPLVIEDLLDSPHYGERWARHWMDVARYSDGLGGFLDNGTLPEAWRYRDWVVSALNRDLPYDEFVRQQIAGDVMSKPKQTAAATGFFAVGPTYRSDGGDPEAKAQALAETLSDRVDTFSRGFMGLTAACARCHDHKFDPITAKDYYALAGVFKNSNVREFPLADAAVVKVYREHQKKIADRDKELKRAKRAQTQAGKDRIKELQEEIAALKKSAPAKYDFVHALGESGKVDMNVAIRGDLRKKGELVPRRFLELIEGALDRPYTKGSGRVELAASVADPANPLTARVFVNRVWQWHFGEALVRTPSNFGVLGEKPTHPRLLDWLTATFVQKNWSIKELHRLIMKSASYQMSSAHNDANFDLDGDNRFLWRMNPRRLEVEVWRDSLLVVSGLLDHSLGGRPDNEILDSRRRTLYGTVSRNGDRFRSDKFRRTFDFPAARSTSAARTTSTVPQQYLFMMNSKFIGDCAKALTARLERGSPNTDGRIKLAYQTLFQREPDEFEIKIAR